MSTAVKQIVSFFSFSSRLHGLFSSVPVRRTGQRWEATRAPLRLQTICRAFLSPAFFFDRLEPCAKSRGFGGSAPKSFSIGSHACVSLSVRSFCGWRFRRSPPSIRADLCCVRHQIPHPPFGGLERTAFKAQPSHPRFFSCRTQGQPVHFSNRFNALASTDFFRSPGFFPALPVQLNSLTPLSASLPPAPGPDPHTATTPPTASAPAPRCLACAPVRRAWRTFRDTTR